MHVETGATNVEKSLNVVRDKDGVSINVVNNYKMYNLLTSVMYKRQMYEKDNTRKVYN